MYKKVEIQCFYCFLSLWNNFGVECLIESTVKKVFIILKSKPGSKREGISSISEDEICICIKAPPIEGKANLAIVKYFAEIFDISKSNVVIEKGETNKNKVISVKGSYTDEEVFDILNKNMI